MIVVIEKKHMVKYKSKIMQIKCLIFLLFSTIVFSQNKAIVPTKGAIVFKKLEIISDVEKYKKSMGAMSSKMVDFQIEKELMDNLMKPSEDSIQINELKQTLKSIIEEDINQDIENKDLKYHQIFKKQLIVNYQTFNDNTYENYKIIDTYKNTLKIVDKDSITIISDNVNYQYSQDEVIEINEFREETKKINNFKCFKVILLFKPNYNEDDEFENFMNKYIHKRELWVTDKIKCTYHPIENHKEIITKYYPLEIIESNEVIEGHFINYATILFSIK